MSVLIKGFKMPEDCRDCPLEMYYMNSGETRCRAGNKLLAENFKAILFDGRPDWCPLEEVPEPYGEHLCEDEVISCLEGADWINEVIRIFLNLQEEGTEE